jgi:hypothetical protein
MSHGIAAASYRSAGCRRMVSIDRCVCFAINPMRLSCRRNRTSKISCIFQLPFFNEHDVCCHLPGRQNGSVKMPYFNTRAVDYDISQFEGLEFGTSKASSHVHHSRAPINFRSPLMRFFSPLKNPCWNACFRSGWTDWRNVMRQLVVEYKECKKSEDDPSFTQLVSRCSLSPDTL